jgi:hypothetical protein
LFDRNIGRLRVLEDMVNNIRAVGGSSGRETCLPSGAMDGCGARVRKWPILLKKSKMLAAPKTQSAPSGHALSGSNGDIRL